MISALLVSLVSALVIGDSISDNSPDLQMTGLPYCLMADMDCLSVAVSGSSTAGWVSSGVAVFALPHIPEYTTVSIMLGTNDASGGVTKAVYKANILDIIAQLKVGGATKFVLHNPSYRIGFQAEIDSYAIANAEIIAADSTVIVGWDARELGNEGSYAPWKNTIDGIHWSDAAHIVAARALEYHVVPEPGTSIQLATVGLTLAVLARRRGRNR